MTLAAPTAAFEVAASDGRAGPPTSGSDASEGAQAAGIDQVEHAARAADEAALAQVAQHARCNPSPRPVNDRF
jgi:hypothetical protein